MSLFSFIFLWLALPGGASAQDRFKNMPGYDQFTRMSKEIPGSVRLGSLTEFREPGTGRGGPSHMAKWNDGGKSFDYQKDGKNYHFDISARTATEIPATQESLQQGGGRGAGPERGRQVTSIASPDGTRKAFYRERNLWVSSPDGSNETAVTSDGSEKARIKYATGSWVYGEELGQTTAMWWSPDGRKIAFYRFDESKVPDYYLQLDQTKLQSRMDVEAYPKAGIDNPIADLLVYDLESRKLIPMDVRDGKPFENSVVGYYVYNISWTPDGGELLFNRTNRRQNIMELTSANPETGKCRVVIHEEWPASWVENKPTMRWLKDRKRFIWESDRTGFKNYYLYDFSGKLLVLLTNHTVEVAGIVQVNEDAGILYYLARDGDNYMKLQLHRVGLDGKGDRRLTDPTLNHTVDVSPDGTCYLDRAETHDIPPTTRLMAVDGKTIAELATSDTTKFDQLGLKKVELFTYRAADLKTELHAMLHFPSGFESGRKYPVLVSVYGGPATNGAREIFTLPSALTELGFLYVTLDTRSAAGRGKQLLDSIYLHLGITEIDDMAAAIRFLGRRPYVDAARVGIYGTSYGGYASLMCLLRYPDVFSAASSSSPVTDWKNYDSIYTERYMWIPQENREGYDAGSALTYVDKLKGNLMLYYGTADNNVHPSNMMQLIQGLQRAGKSFEVQVGPDAGHSGLRQDRMLEFFIENLILHKEY
jgi:dipeptidyl-peptidase 4